MGVQPHCSCGVGCRRYVALYFDRYFFFSPADEQWTVRLNFNLAIKKHTHTHTHNIQDRQWTERGK